ncbi:hypothetical protein HYV88_02775 [Candidatus Woesearchaeota archaeon]|nr:hypothetical protein [Candidatus Woesearchaeota archaeon]
MVQNIDFVDTLSNDPDSISDKVVLTQTERIIQVQSEYDESVPVEVSESWRPYSETRTLLNFLFRPIRSIRALFEIADYNVDVRYALYKKKEA